MMRLYYFTIIVSLAELNSSSYIAPRNSLRCINSRDNVVSLTALVTGGLLLTTLPAPCVAKPLVVNECDDPVYVKSVFNLPPGVMVFPDYFEGTWATKFSFADAKFTKQFSMDELSKDVNVAGFRKYGVAYMPDIGANFGCDLRYIMQSGKVLEDRSFNLMNIIQSATTGSADLVEYDAKKDANRCSVKYHDAKGSGQQEMFTNYRKSGTSPDGSFGTVENIRQSTVRSKVGQRASQTIVDYGLQWNFLKISPTSMSASFKIISYLMPQDNLYFVRPEKPVGIFLYDIEMTKQ